MSVYAITVDSTVVLIFSRSTTFLVCVLLINTLRIRPLLRGFVLYFYFQFTLGEAHLLAHTKKRVVPLFCIENIPSDLKIGL